MVLCWVIEQYYSSDCWWNWIVYGVERGGKIMCEFMWFRMIYIHLIIREKIKTSQVVDRKIPINPRMYPKTGS